MLSRTLEPEVMDTEEEAADYDAMDHEAVNRAFCEDALAALGARAKNASVRALDLGTGTALIPIQMCKLHTSITVLGTDLARQMLAVAKANVARAGLEDRVSLSFGDAKNDDQDRTFDLVVSNSVIHHIPEPADLLRAALTKLAPGGTVFIRDLERPTTEVALEALVQRYAPLDASKPELERQRDERQRGLLAASLRAALTLDEIRAIGKTFAIPEGAFTRTSDRHWTLAWTRS